jgi:hypothetical protein
MAKPALPTSTRLGPVAIDRVYPLKVFSELTGLGGWALRKAQRDGLRLCGVGRCKFVRGVDFHEYLEKAQNTTTD